MSTTTIQLPTDLLWNAQDPSEAESYASFVAQVGDDEVVEEKKEYQRTFKHKGKEKVFATDRHQFVNMLGVEKRGDDFLIGGICLFKRVAEGEFRLTDEGQELKHRYQSDDESAWKPYLLELLGQYFIRFRSIMYYIGVKGCTYEYQGNQTLYGDEGLVKGNAQYVIYRTSRDDENGELTLIGYANRLVEEDFETDLIKDICRTYKYEYTLLQSGLEHQNIANRIENIKQNLDQLLTDAGTDTDTLVSEIRSICEQIIEAETSATEPDKYFTRCPNLLVDANISPIIGPFLHEKIEILSGTEINEFELTGNQGHEPLGGNMIIVIHRALRYALYRGILVEEDGRLVLDRRAAEAQCSDELVADIFQTEFELERDDQFKEKIWETYVETRDSETRFVLWQNLKDQVTEDTGVSEGEFKDQVEQLFHRDELKIIDKKRGLTIDPPGPPGYRKYPHIILETN